MSKMKTSPAVRDCLARIYQVSTGRYVDGRNFIVDRILGDQEKEDINE